jgi:two-component system response regulator GlrR
MKALIVEDDVNNVDLLRLRLKHLDCQPLVAVDADAALQLAEEQVPDLILLDLKLGNEVLGGITLLDSIKAVPALAEIPVVLHSVYVSFANDLPIATDKADYLLPKPFRFEQLKQIVEEIRTARGQA